MIVDNDNIDIYKNHKNDFAVVFDMDGVIFDSERLSLICWKSLAKKHNLKDIEDVFYNCVGTSYREAELIFNEAYGSVFNFKDFKKEKTELYKQLYDNDKLELKQGAIDILSFLNSHNIKIGLATSTAKAVVNRELGDYKIKLFFDTIVCGDMVEKCKPSPDVYIKACENLGFNPENCYAIEDSFNGIVAANRAGMKVIMVPDLVQCKNLEKEALAIVKQSLFEVKDYFKNILNGEI